MKLAETVTALMGIVKVQGFAVDPLVQDVPVVLQLENCHPVLEEALIETDTPTPSKHPLGQLGLTVPVPATFVDNVSVRPD